MQKFLSGPLLDLVEYGRSRRPPAGKPFATAIALMADMVIRRGMNDQELRGVHACLRQQLRTLTWRSYAWHIPLGKHRFSDGTFELEGRTEILPSSLVATVLLYRPSLDEQGTGLSRVIFSELAIGLEWACYASQFESSLETSASAKLIPERKAQEYISASHCEGRAASDA
jgi:hypothetical protein